MSRRSLTVDPILPANKSFFIPTVPQQPKCRVGYESVGSACFAVKALPNGGGTWSDAQSFCSQTEGTRLATIMDNVENSYVHIELARRANFVNTTRAWIGMKSQTTNGTGGLSWESGCTTRYNHLTNFLAGSPDGTVTCAAMDYGGPWRTQSCADKNEYVVCETRDRKYRWTTAEFCGFFFRSTCRRRRKT